MEYMVRRTTYDKLERFCNSLAAEGWDVFHVEFVGGRDWVLVARRQSEPAMIPSDWPRPERRTA